jgi:hypothetical protein
VDSHKTRAGLHDVDDVFLGLFPGGPQAGQVDANVVLGMDVIADIKKESRHADPSFSWIDARAITPSLLDNVPQFRFSRPCVRYETNGRLLE